MFADRLGITFPGISKCVQNVVKIRECKKSGLVKCS